MTYLPHLPQGRLQSGVALEKILDRCGVGILLCPFKVVQSCDEAVEFVLLREHRSTKANSPECLDWPDYKGKVFQPTYVAPLPFWAAA